MFREKLDKYVKQSVSFRFSVFQRYKENVLIGSNAIKTEGYMH